MLCVTRERQNLAEVDYLNGWRSGGSTHIGLNGGYVIYQITDSPWVSTNRGVAALLHLDSKRKTCCIGGFPNIGGAPVSVRRSLHRIFLLASIVPDKSDRRPVQFLRASSLSGKSGPQSVMGYYCELHEQKVDQE